MNTVLVRKEEEKDYAVVENIMREAFWNLYVPGCDEHYLAHVLRKHPDFISELDLVIELDGQEVSTKPGGLLYLESFSDTVNCGLVDSAGLLLGKKVKNCGK